jgi:hypothetical protein
LTNLKYNRKYSDEIYGKDKNNLQIPLNLSFIVKMVFSLVTDKPFIYSWEFVVKLLIENGGPHWSSHIKQYDEKQGFVKCNI